MEDNVNHPKHYTTHPSGVECITITRHFNFNIGNAIKYLWRAGLKGNAIEDLKKAIWYIEDEIRRMGENSTIEKCGWDGKPCVNVQWDQTSTGIKVPFCSKECNDKWLRLGENSAIEKCGERAAWGVVAGGIVGGAVGAAFFGPWGALLGLTLGALAAGMAAKRRLERGEL